MNSIISNSDETLNGNGYEKEEPLVEETHVETGYEQATGSDEEPVDYSEVETMLLDPTVELEQTKERLLRALAEAENLRKRAQKQVQEARQYALEAFARDLLSVPDNLSRALDALSDEERKNLSNAGTQLLEGIEITCKDLYAVMERNGLSPVPAEPGNDFDPSQHQAVGKVPSRFSDGKIAQVLQTGWYLKGRVLRASIVSVSTGNNEAGADNMTPPEETKPVSNDINSPSPGNSLDIEV